MSTTPVHITTLSDLTSQMRPAGIMPHQQLAALNLNVFADRDTLSVTRPPRSHSNASDTSNNGNAALARPNRDPLSHRIIEKRRRDRMNNCLASLSKLIPQQYMRKGRGRVEKTEIIEMAIEHMQSLSTQGSARSTLHRPKITAEKGLSTDMSGGDVDELLRLATRATSNQRDAYTSGFLDAVRCVTNTPLLDEMNRARVMTHLRQCVTRLQNGASASVESPSEQCEPLNMSLKRARLEMTPRAPQGDVVTSSTTFDISKGPASPSSLSGISTISCISDVDSVEHTGPAIPVFALHTSGIYYVPMTVPACALGCRARASLDEHLSVTRTTQQSTSSTCMPTESLLELQHQCHPVTISVNFCAALSQNTPPPEAHQQEAYPTKPEKMRRAHA